MAIINLSTLTITEAKRMLHDGVISARELVAMYESQVKEKDKKIHAYLQWFDDAYVQAETVDERIQSGMEPRALEGVPFAIKDNILIKGKIASAASKILQNYNASYDAYVIQKLREAGAVFLGRTNMDEFAMGSSTENSAYGPTKNPHDTSRVPGGSSGGSAAAVSAGMALAALGSDTGGSIRQPAAFCGVVGLKPTYGTVSRSGLIAMASSLDQIGPFANSVEDAELIFNVIRGKDEKDSTTVAPEGKSLLKKPVIGIPHEFGFDRQGMMDEDIQDSVERARELLRADGYEVRDVLLPHTPYALAIYYIIMPAEVSSNLARFDGVRYGYHAEAHALIDSYKKTRSYGFGKESQRRILLGSYVLSAGYYEAYYSRAQKVRSLLINDFQNAFKEVDVLLTPATPTPAFRFEEKVHDPVQMYASDVFTVSANLVGIPALVLPSGKVVREDSMLPIGIQLMGSWFAEPSLFEVGKAIERLYV